MLKHVSFICAALLALTACSHNGSDNNATPANSTPTQTSTSATPTSSATTPNAPAAASTSATTTETSSSSSSTAASTADQKPTAPPAEPFVDTGKWVEGKNYFKIEPAQPTGIPDKIVVTEAFSWACPACNSFHTFVDQIANSLPANATMNYLPVSFRPDENFPLFQRAYFAAKALGVADKSSDKMFDAVWKSGQLATDDLTTGRPKPQAAWPTIDDIAKFYANNYGIDAKQFVAVANSFSVNTQMKRADDMVKALGVDATPTIIVNGKYRFSPGDAGGYSQSIELTKWLVAKEAAGK